MASRRRLVTYKRANNILLVCIVVINGYIIAAPLLPRAEYWWQTHRTQKQADLMQLLRTPTVANHVAPRQPNQLIIPKMVLDQPTLEGPKSNWFNLLKAGIWRWPDGSTPDKGSNTIFLAHRFSYTGPRGAFYFLNKLAVGDDIGVIWNNKTYTYRVTSSTEVPPTDTTIENPTANAQITLFTCTPLWHPVNRLVVVAKLIGHS